MHVFIWFMILVYGMLLLFIFLYSCVQFSLAIRYKRNRRVEDTQALDKFPNVTIQLPIFNEKYVAARLINAVVQMDYPSEALEIQILDDSDDETKDIVDQKVKEFAAQGIDIKVIRRNDRIGFKAGALALGTSQAKGEFIAIFDADFLPEPDFLKQTVGQFTNPKLGMVQTRWKHLNQRYSLLTELQAFGLDAHFSIEQVGRNQGGHFINFNGTGGVWRKSTIADAGGWQSDTLTEDLDLSYRAQLKGWEFKYLEHVGAPAELPAVMNALKTQQYRWTKGGAECAVKNLPKVLAEKGLSWKTKWHASFHLLNTFVFVCILLSAVLSLPMLLVKTNFEEYKLLFLVASIFSLSFFFLAYFYWVSANRSAKMGFLQFIVRFPLFLSIFMGLSLHNAIAVIEGYLGRKTPFVRTPKFNLKERNDSWMGNIYLRKQVNPLTYFELLLAIYFIAAAVIGIQQEEYGLMPFHIMLAGGFSVVAVYSFLHSARS